MSQVGGRMHAAVKDEAHEDVLDACLNIAAMICVDMERGHAPTAGSRGTAFVESSALGRFRFHLRRWRGKAPS